jgi:hypothetical protein
LLTGEGGDCGGAKSYDGEKAWSSMNHSITSVYLPTRRNVKYDNISLSLYVLKIFQENCDLIFLKVYNCPARITAVSFDRYLLKREARRF